MRGAMINKLAKRVRDTKTDGLSLSYENNNNTFKVLTSTSNEDLVLGKNYGTVLLVGKSNLALILD